MVGDLAQEINTERDVTIPIEMSEQKGKAEEVAEKTGEVVGKGIKKGVEVVRSFGKGLKQGVSDKKDEEQQ